MIQLQFIRQYRKPAVIENKEVIKPSKLVFVYGVSGTPEQLAEYQKIKGVHHKIDDVTKMPLFFSPRFAGKTAQAELNTEKTDWRIDTTAEDQIQNLMSQGYSYEHAKDIAGKTAA